MRRPLADSVIVPIVAATALLAALTGCSRDDEAEPAPTEPDIEEVDCGEADTVREAPTVEPPAAAPTALAASEIRPGLGREAQDGDTLFVDYVGIRSEDGTVIDSSYDRDVPLDFVLGRGRVIDGWDQGLVGATTGSMVRLDVPGELAYGDTPPGDPIQPGDALSFVIEVRAVVAPPADGAGPLDLDIAPSTGATDLTVADLTVGTGDLLTMGDTAIFNALLVRGDNGVVLRNTWEVSDGPFVVELSDPPIVMPGVVQGLQCARVGGRRVMTLPPAWAFGPDGQPNIGLPAGTDLIVVADIIGAY